MYYDRNEFLAKEETKQNNFNCLFGYYFGN